MAEDASIRAGARVPAVVSCEAAAAAAGNLAVESAVRPVTLKIRMRRWARHVWQPP